MRRPPGPPPPWLSTAPGPGPGRGGLAPEASDMSRTPDRHFGAFSPSATKANTSPTGRAIVTSRSADGMASPPYELRFSLPQDMGLAIDGRRERDIHRVEDRRHYVGGAERPAQSP